MSQFRRRETILCKRTLGRGKRKHITGMEVRSREWEHMSFRGTRKKWLESRGPRSKEWRHTFYRNK